MGKIVIRSSEALYECYKAYMSWIEAGAEGDSFIRTEGLCEQFLEHMTHSRGYDTGIRVVREIQRAFKRAGLDICFPFNNPNRRRSSYEKETCTGTCHLNPDRIAWVRARIEDGISE